MSRRHKAEKREIFPDPKFNDEVISKFMNNLTVSYTHLRAHET